VPQEAGLIFEIRDVFLALSFFVSFVSLGLHWYRGRKVVTYEWSDTGVESNLVERSRNGRPPRFSNTAFAKLIINNETRHPAKIVNATWSMPRKMPNGAISDFGFLDGEPRTVMPNTLEKVHFTRTPNWSDIQEALSRSNAEDASSSSSAESRSSITITLSLNIQSKAFWFRSKRTSIAIEIPASRIKNAIRDM
jgi:hypothetical protein